MNVFKINVMLRRQPVKIWLAVLNAIVNLVLNHLITPAVQVI